MKKYFILFVLAVTVSVSFSCNSSTSQARAEATEYQEAIITKNISAAEFQKLMNDNAGAIILDVRTPEEVAKGSIKNAKKINFYDKDFKAQLDKLDKSKPVLIYCHSGRRSGMAMSSMRAMGFTEVYNLQGGIVEWSDAGMEIVK